MNRRTQPLQGSDETNRDRAHRRRLRWPHRIDAVRRLGYVDVVAVAGSTEESGRRKAEALGARKKAEEENHMRPIHKVTGAIALTLLTATAIAQQPPPPPANAANPVPGCTATPAQLAANKRVAMQFFRVQGDERVALADPSYKQHNPAFKKRGEDAKISDYEEFKNSFSTAALAAAGWAGSRPCCRSATPARQPVRDRDRGVRSGDRDPPEQPPGSDGRGWKVLRSLHVRHVPHQEREARGALGWRGDQPASARRRWKVVRREAMCRRRLSGWLLKTALSFVDNIDAFDF